jgi:hypothetical protein
VRLHDGSLRSLRVRRKGVSKGALRMRLRVEPSCPNREIGGTTQVDPQILFLLRLAYATPLA